MDTKDQKPKVVATIDVNIIPPVESKRWIEESIEEHLQCVLCGGELNFKHKTDFLAQTVSEDASCSCCGVRTRQTSHRLQ